LSTNSKFATTEVFLKYKGKSVAEYSTFSEKIACARVNYKGRTNTHKGLSLTVAAKKIGIGTHHLRCLELGIRSNPNFETVHNMNTFYGFQPGELAELLHKENAEKKKVAQ
jgi:hypothetical protein